MPDEAEIKNILLELGLYSFAMAYVSDERELFRLFHEDFSKLMEMCSK